MTTIADLARQALALRSQRFDALAAIKDDPDATELANAYYRETQTKAIETRYAEQMAAIREQATQMAADAKTTAAPHLAFDNTDMSALIRSEQAWTHVVRPQLEKGHSLAQALAGADTDAVHGAQRFAGAFIAAKTSPGAGLHVGERRPNTEQVYAAIATRMAELKPQHAEEILAGATADAHLQAFRSVLVLADRGDDLGAAIAIQYEFGSPGRDVDTTDVDASIEDAQGSHDAA
ncbi:hypothetical protein [Rhodococcus ruber]|uniref:hypothetical protein n=1 Tax=Rhodococcus ruber TaxID=1830 RepID=UPI003784D4D8